MPSAMMAAVGAKLGICTPALKYRNQLSGQGGWPAFRGQGLDYLDSRQPGVCGPRWAQADGILPSGQFGLPIGHAGRVLQGFGLVCIQGL